MRQTDLTTDRNFHSNVQRGASQDTNDMQPCFAQPPNLAQSNTTCSGHFHLTEIPLSDFVSRFHQDRDPDAHWLPKQDFTY